MAIGPGSAREGNRRGQPPVRTGPPIWRPSVPQEPEPLTRFAVVIVLHESAGVLPSLLRSLERHTPEAQVVVVDAASSDDGAQLAGDAGAEVLELGENRGFGAACNAGVARARHPVTVLLNPDCELLDGKLGELASAAAEREALWAP